MRVLPALGTGPCAAADGATARPFATRVDAQDSLRTALDALISSWTGVAVRVSEGDHYEGLLTRELLTAELNEDVRSAA